MAFISVCYPSLIGFSFPLALTFYPSAGPCRGPTNYRINTKTPQRSSTAAIGGQSCVLLLAIGEQRSCAIISRRRRQFSVSSEFSARFLHPQRRPAVT